MRVLALGIIHMLWCLPLISKGQNKISGRVFEGQKGLPGASIVMVSPTDSSFVKGSVSDVDGAFTIDGVKNGQYRLTVSMVGYAGFSSIITVDKEDLVLKDIILAEASVELDEVIVTAERAAMEQQPDRMVINVQNSITSAGNTVLEILQKSPGVMVNRQSNVISVNGRTGARLMVNGKLLQMPADAAMQMLDGMNASGVERIELIAVPSSKYDADGNAGIVNIVTRQNDEYGASGLAGILFGWKWAEIAGGNFNFNRRSRQSEWFVDYAMTRTRNLHLMQFNSRWIEGGDRHANDNSSYRPNLTNQHNLSTGLHLRLSEKVSLNFLFSGYRRHWTLNAVTTDLVTVLQDSTALTSMAIREKNLWQSATGSAGLTLKPDSRNEWGFHLDYLFYNNNNPSTYHNTAQGGPSVISLTKDTPIRMFVGRMDYQYQYSPTLTLEAGAKGIHSGLDNTVIVTRLQNNILTTDSTFSSDSQLSEKTGAAYVSGNWKATQRTDVTGGLRYEYTHTAIQSVSREPLVDRKYGYVFPNFLVKTQFAPERDLQLSYSRRITRPTYNDIAPFVFFWGPNTFSAGNAALWPAVSDAASVSYHVRRLTTTLQYNSTKREIINLFQPERDTVNNTVTFRSQNLVYLNTFSLSASWSMNPAPWWEVQATALALYQVARTGHFTNNVTMTLPGVNLNVSSSMKFKKGIALEVSGFFQSTSFYGVSKFLPYGTLNAGLQKKLGNSAVKLSMDDILYTNVWRIRTRLPQEGLDANIRYDWHNQFVRLTYTYNLGQTFIRPVKIKSGSAEEQKRVN